MINPSVAILILACAFILVAIGWCLLQVGKMQEAQRQASRQADLALIASFFAATESRSLAKAPIIQKIIEKHHMGEAGEGREVDPYEEVNEDFEDFLSNSQFFSKERARARAGMNVQAGVKQDDDKEWDGEIEETISAQDAQGLV